MARPKKVVAAKVAPKELTYTLTKEQFESLKAAASLVSDARRELNGFDAENLAHAGFIVGQAFVAINKAEDLVDDLVNDFMSDDDDEDLDLF